MSLISLSYEEYENDSRHWKLEQCDFTRINLVVGRNSTGKTRLMRVISGLCKVLSAQQTNPFDSGTYKAGIVLSGKNYLLEFSFANGQVMRESLEVDGEKRLIRDASGRGEIYYEKQESFIEFEVPPTALAIQQRRDNLQHSFVVELSKWAEGCQTYFFGTSFGQDRLIGLSSLQALRQERPLEADDLVASYTKAFEQYREPFDEAIKRDMEVLGYDLTDVGADDMRALTPGLRLPEAVIGLFVTERGRDIKLPQMNMSQGMFRALALVIHINIAAFGKQHTLVLVDDIGEGLDFERSSKLIDLLIRHANDTGQQLIMTSNDRFVMNRVPLEYWSLLRRSGSTVRAYTERNSPEKFAEFKYMGLSNFDFFTSETFQ
ncbi:MAG: ATP-binding protein [Pseudomonadota bacterium]